jgi:hypothetical protein
MPTYSLQAPLRRTCYLSLEPQKSQRYGPVSAQLSPVSGGRTVSTQPTRSRCRLTRFAIPWRTSSPAWSLPGKRCKEVPEAIGSALLQATLPIGSAPTAQSWAAEPGLRGVRRHAIVSLHVADGPDMVAMMVEARTGATVLT